MENGDVSRTEKKAAVAYSIVPELTSNKGQNHEKCQRMRYPSEIQTGYLLNTVQRFCHFFIL